MKAPEKVQFNTSKEPKIKASNEISGLINRSFIMIMAITGSLAYKCQSEEKPQVTDTIIDNDSKTTDYSELMSQPEAIYLDQSSKDIAIAESGPQETQIPQQIEESTDSDPSKHRPQTIESILYKQPNTPAEIRRKVHQSIFEKRPQTSAPYPSPKLIEMVRKRRESLRPKTNQK